MSAALHAATYRIHRYPSALIDRLVLDDGRTVTVRPVLPQDAEAEQSFVAALSPASRRERFHLTLNMLPESVLKQFTEIDYRTHIALVAEATGDGDEPILVADARYVRGADPAVAEFALVVADAWQGVGLGSALLRRLVQHARRNGVARLQGELLVSNAAMATLARRFGARLSFVAGDATLLRASISC